MKNITVGELKKMLNDTYDDNNIVICGFEGLSFYKTMENQKYSFIGKIDFNNERSRVNKIFGIKKNKDYLE